jgi:hypothetical protein
MYLIDFFFAEELYKLLQLFKEFKMLFITYSVY